MILSKIETTTDAFLDVNNDIYRIISVLNGCQEIKRLLKYTDKRPFEDKEDIKEDMRDIQICRVPVLPEDGNEGSMIVVTMVDGVVYQDSITLGVALTIDVFTPSSQWIINEGVRPLFIAHVVDNLVRNEFEQTGGVKYRLDQITNAQLSDVLVGYRMIYHSIIND